MTTMSLPTKIIEIKTELTFLQKRCNLDVSDSVHTGENPEVPTEKCLGLSVNAKWL